MMKHPKYMLLVMFLVGLMATSCQQKIYLFSSFHEPANQGLRLLYSIDGYHWKDLDTIFLKPLIGKDAIMRDPSILQGPDGIFHLVWTTEWKGGNGFGYARSKDLIHWTKEKYIPVMQHEPTVANVWAPELFYDNKSQQFIIVWASCVPFRYAKGMEDENNNHRLYYTTTNDFQSFTETKLFLDPAFSAIDAVIVKQRSDQYALVVKDNTRPERNIKVALGPSPLGPFEKVSEAFTDHFTEGPAVAKVKNGWLVYYDAYREKKFGAVFTQDFISFSKADSLIDVPAGHKHGTIFTANKKYLKTLLTFSHATK